MSKWFSRCGKVAAVLLFLAVGVASLLDAASNASRLLPPAVAAELGISPGRALTAMGEQLLSLQRTDGPSVSSEIDLARKALRHTPLRPKALRNLAFSLGKAGEQAEARQVMEQAIALTRRDGVALLWMSEVQARAGNDRAALRGLDLALRTSPTLQDLVFPYITQGLARREFRGEFVVYLRQKPNWLARYLYVGIDQPTGEENIARAVILAKGLPDGEDFREIERRLLERLVLHRHFDLARSVFLVTRDHDVSLLTLSEFGGPATETRFGGLAWQFGENPLSSGAFIDTNDGEAMSVLVEAGSETEVASKLLFLPEGRYRLSARRVPGSAIAEARITLELACAETGTRLVSLQVPPGNSSAAIPVPATCDTQVLRVRAATASELGDSGATIARIGLDRLDD